MIKVFITKVGVKVACGSQIAGKLGDRDVAANEVFDVLIGDQDQDSEIASEPS